MDCLACSERCDCFCCPQRLVCPRCRSISFLFRKLDSESKKGLFGAVFELRYCNRTIAAGISGPDGTVCFPCICCGEYQLLEITPPSGYQPQEESWRVVVDKCGELFVNHLAADDFTVYNKKIVSEGFDVVFRKVDAISGEELAGALFGLFQNDDIIEMAESAIDGVVRFTGIHAGSYILREMRPPLGYLSDSEDHFVVVEESGIIMIDHILAPAFIVNDKLYSELEIYKMDEKEMGLSGALFELRQENLPIAQAMTDANGFAMFEHLEPGMYTLAEIKASDDYRPNPRTYAIEAKLDGTIWIDGEQRSSLIIPQ